MGGSSLVCSGLVWSFGWCMHKHLRRIPRSYNAARKGWCTTFFVIFSHPLLTESYPLSSLSRAYIIWKSILAVFRQPIRHNLLLDSTPKTEEADLGCLITSSNHTYCGEEVSQVICESDSIASTEGFAKSHRSKRDRQSSTCSSSHQSYSPQSHI